MSSFVPCLFPPHHATDPSRVHCILPFIQSSAPEDFLLSAGTLCRRKWLLWAHYVQNLVLGEAKFSPWPCIAVQHGDALLVMLGVHLQPPASLSPIESTANCSVHIDVFSWFTPPHGALPFTLDIEADPSSLCSLRLSNREQNP